MSMPAITVLSFGANAELIEYTAVPWASAGRAGVRHEARLALPTSRDALAFAAEIAEHEFQLPGALVADITAHAAGALVEVEALTLPLD